ncbi:MAG: DUF3658 domain-containing protein [Polyangiales bacterium]
MSAKPDLSTCVHVIVGDSAGGTLRLAFPEFRIERVADNFSVGPLHANAQEQAALRQEYWEAMERDLGVDPARPPALRFDADAAMLERVRAEMGDGRPLVLWLGGWAFERIAGAYLIEQLLGDTPDAPAFLVESETCLSLLPPDALRSLADDVRPLGVAQGSARAAWSELHSTTIPAYRWHMEPPGLLFQMPKLPWRTVLGTELHGDEGAVLDARILEQVSEEWKRAAVVVGHVLADCPLGDRIVHWRIAKLCQSGQLEYEGELHALRHFSLRRA